MKRIPLIVLLLVTAFIVNAQVIYVPSGQPTIQAAIDAASAGDTVVVDDNTYYENINFKGKPITVASRFILDRDTAHISGTVIDGSQPVHPDSASVVMMISGEDTTSVLMGFTITGGKGTNHDEDGFSERGGGGIYINGSGGKIIHNIIRDNHLQGGDRNWQYGGGIFAYVFKNHTLIIRDNDICQNIVTGQNCCGGGITFMSGKVVCERNEIFDNTLDAQEIILGGGISCFCFNKTGVIEEIIIRNNFIFGNIIYSNDVSYGGGGIAINEGFTNKVEIYNNIIANNISDSYGGALSTGYNVNAAIINNTIVGNESTQDGHSLAIGGNANVVLFNNIIWSSVDNQLADIFLSNISFIQLNNNVLKESLEPQDFLTTFDNIYEEPVFINSSYELAEDNPGIGAGVESVEIQGITYFAPLSDYNGNLRPNPVDNLVDIGAVESPYSTGFFDRYSRSGNEIFAIYPNPVQDVLHIETEIAGLYEVSIHSVNGQVLISRKMEGTINQVDFSSVQKGVYIITIRSRDLVTTRKLIKL